MNVARLVALLCCAKQHLSASLFFYINAADFGRASGSVTSTATQIVQSVAGVYRRISNAILRHATTTCNASLHAGLGRDGRGALYIVHSIPSTDVTRRRLSEL